MSSNKEQNKNKYKYIVPKAPKPKITIIPKNISYINLIEVDDDSESSQHEELSVSSKNSKNAMMMDIYLMTDMKIALTKNLEKGVKLIPTLEI